MSTRAEFLARVRAEVAKASGRCPAEVSTRPADPAGAADAARERARAEVQVLVARFQTEAERVGVGVHRVQTLAEAAELVRGLAEGRGARHVVSWSRRALGPTVAVVDRLRAAGLEVAEAPDAPDERDRQTLRETMASAEIGLTSADIAIAETGTLVLTSGAGKPRGTSLLPACHVAVLGRDRLVRSLEETGALLEAWSAAPPAGTGANVVFVTGPSRTADIELTLTRGVHGPKEVHAVLVDAL